MAQLHANAILVGATLYWLAAAKSGNMNGKYSVSSGDRQDVPFNDDYATKGHEYFDVWAPEIATHYGEVFWTDQGNQPIPDHIVKRFAGKVLAITGYEQDQVMVDPVGHPGANPDSDVSVPINWAYNHHYMAWMTGQHSELRKVHAEAGDHMAHGASTKWIAVDRPSAATRKDPSIPTSQMFSEGNGGESRKSFHGYPEGFAQLIDSPTTWHITPMQIDTRNRDCGATPADIKNCTRFTPGPEPKQARYGLGIPAEGTNYSGILECPCNSRYGGDPVFYPTSKTKIVERKYELLGSGTCIAGQGVDSATDCFAAASTLGINASRFVNSTVSDPKLPEGCSFVEERNGTAFVYFNTGGNATCRAGSMRSGEVRSDVGVTFSLELDSTSLFKRSAMGKYCSLNRAASLKVFPMRDASFDAAYEARNQCETYCWDDATCWGCTVDCADSVSVYGRLGQACQWNAVSSCGKVLDWVGRVAGDVSQKAEAGGKATITVSGPSEAWFGVGLNASAMVDSPYTLVFSDEGVFEQKIGTCGSEAEHCPGTRLASSVTLVSNIVSSGVRSVKITRAFAGISKDHYSFDPFGDETLRLIMAVGQGQKFAYHKAHSNAQIALTSDGSATCICDVGATGKLCETGGQKCAQFVKNCVGPPAGSLLEQNNPTCNSAQYAGGLNCCHHKRIMLDADQEIRPELLRYHMKFRFWFQEYTAEPKSHSDLPRIYYQTEANAGEYDIPPAFAKPGHRIPGYPSWPPHVPTPGTSCTGNCPDGPDCECVHTITYHWTVSNMRLIYAGGHCHAPSCIYIELYRNDTGRPQLLCRQRTKYGKGNFPEDRFDEAGYVALPPCLWSDDDPSLEPTQWLPANTPLFSIKKNRNTHMGHYGEMASWQMRGVFFPATPPNFI